MCAEPCEEWVVRSVCASRVSFVCVHGVILGCLDRGAAFVDRVCAHRQL